MVLLNLLMVVILLAGLIWNRMLWKEVLKAIALMCLNIPVAILYICFVFYLLDTMRITFVNDRSVAITDVRIDGCESKQLGDLDPGASITSWIDIPGDCSVSLHYRMGGKQVEEVVEGYVCRTNGQAKTYHIDGKPRPPL
ncbi:MAG: hypothetical protein JST90_16085 [Bacteroidetes bacterium]|nr:hypothetical protein [Bacteroidota bacterium]